IACCWTPIPRIHSAMPSQVITAMLPNDRLRGPAHDTTSGNTPQCPQGPLQPPVRHQRLAAHWVPRFIPHLLHQRPVGRVELKLPVSFPVDEVSLDGQMAPGVEERRAMKLPAGE